jgi:two-component system chemotaxis sensor kinase CheA
MESELDMLREQVATLTDLLSVQEEQSSAQFTLIRTQRQELEAAYKAVRRLLDTVDQGFATLDPAGAVRPGRSAVFDRWFGTPADGTPFVECLRRVDAEAAELFDLGWWQLQEGALPFELLVMQLPAEASWDERFFRIDYRPALDAGGALIDMLVVITDVTAQVERERAEGQQRDLLALMSRLATDRDGFVEFIREADRIVHLIDQVELDAVALKRALHTLKGVSALFGAHTMAVRCHEFESRLDELAALPSMVERRSFTAAWFALREQIAMLAPDDREVVSVARADIENLRGRTRRLSPTQISQALAMWMWEPVQQRLSRLGAQAEALARQLGKGAIDVRIDSKGLAFEPERWSTFWAAATHLISNCVDHGLESVEERASKGKPERARVTLRTCLVDDRVVIEVGDDGRGIDWAALARKASARGLDTSSQQALIEALFADGVTTKQDVTLHSGRGVGLAAVRAACDALQGTIEVDSRPNDGTTFRFTLPAIGIANGTSAPA